MRASNPNEPQGVVTEGMVDGKKRSEEDEGGTAPPSVEPTPAAQPPSPRPSITGAETAHTQNESHLDGFLFSVDWLAFTVPSSTVEEVQQRLGGEWMELKKGFNGYPRAWLNVSTGGGSGHGDRDAPSNTRGACVPLR